MCDFQPRLEEGLATLGLEASVDQVDQLMRFAGLLQKWNKVYNLTAIRRDDEILTHHLLDSAALVPFVKRLGPDAVNVLDVGSGEMCIRDSISAVSAASCPTKKAETTVTRNTMTYCAREMRIISEMAYILAVVRWVFSRIEF